MVAQWLVVGLTIKRSQVRDQARTWLGYNFGQVVHTHVPLSPSSIIWYRRKPGHEQAHHAMHWPHVHGMLVSGWGLQKQRSAPPYGPMWLGEDFTYLAFDKLMVVLMSQCVVLVLQHCRAFWASCQYSRQIPADSRMTCRVCLLVLFLTQFLQNQPRYILQQLNCSLVCSTSSCNAKTYIGLQSFL